MPMVSDVVLGVFDIVGAIGFTAAAVMAFHTFQLTRTVSSYWLLYAAATMVSAVWALLLALEKFGFHAQFIDSIVGAMVASAATAFAMAALLTAVSLIQPTE